MMSSCHRASCHILRYCESQTVPSIARAGPRGTFPSVRFRALGGLDKVVRRLGAGFLAIGDPNRERRGRRLKRANFQSGTCKTIERLGNHCNASARFDRRDETGNAVVFLDNLRRTIQWRKQVCDPCLMLWIVRKGESNESESRRFVWRAGYAVCRLGRPIGGSIRQGALIDSTSETRQESNCH